MTTLYEYLYARKGAAYRSDQIKEYSWLKKKPEVDLSIGRLAGNSRIHGDASQEVQGRVIDLMVEVGVRYKLSYRDIAHMLLLAKVESGFNPDAAAGTTSAAGLGQFTKATVDEAAKDHISKRRLKFTLDLRGEHVFDAQRGAYGVLLSYMICKERAISKFGNDYEASLYLFHHEGWYFRASREELQSANVKAVYQVIKAKILPHLAPVEHLLKGKTDVQFELTTREGSAYSDQPFVAVRPQRDKGSTVAPRAAQRTNPGLLDVVLGRTDASGKTPTFSLKALEEVVFVILNRDYKALVDVRSVNGPTYQVKRGETIGDIARRNGSSVDDVARINGISDPDRVRAGQVIKLPGAQATYTVKRGDTLDRIAAKNGITLKDLARLNNISDPDRISVGQELVLFNGARLPRRPDRALVATILSETLNMGSFGALDAIIEHSRSHIVLPKGNEAHRGEGAANVISIKGGSSTDQVIQRAKEKHVPHRTSEAREPKEVQRPGSTLGKPLREKMLFPMSSFPRQSYKEGMRAFGFRRGGGKRKHAGCDIYAPIGTIVRAMDDGKVVQVAPFYLGTDEVVVDHGGFLIRYGEVMPGAHFVKVGDEVRRGQALSKVGKLEGLSQSMLHIEAYTSSLDAVKHPLTIKGAAPYMRRSDLVDITPTLDSAVLKD